jgi:regulator of protease activity HflC (stomatin/prohibitin superfamily)
VSKYVLYELMSDPVKLGELDKSITEKLSAYIASIKLPVKVENVALGRAKPTVEVLAQINESARQKEAKTTNANKAGAEEERKDSETKRALADKAYANEMGMNPSQFVQLRMVEMQTTACMKATNCVIGLDRITPAGE